MYIISNYSEENNQRDLEDELCDSDDDDDEYAAMEHAHTPPAPPKRATPEFDPLQESFANE